MLKVIYHRVTTQREDLTQHHPLMVCIFSLAFVLAWDLDPMIPPPHFFLISSNLSLKLACKKKWNRQGMGLRLTA